MKFGKLSLSIMQVTENVEPSEGFWREFYLLPPDRTFLRRLLDGISPDDTLLLQVSALIA
jgi:hypothetical protein